MHYLESVEFSVLTEKGGASKQLADNWGFFRLPARHRRHGRPQRPHRRAGRVHGEPAEQAGSPGSGLPEVHDEPGQRAEDDRRPRLAQRRQGIGDGAELVPAAERKRSTDIDKASQFAIWLDTVTNADVAGAYLSGVEGIIDGSQTPQQVMSVCPERCEEGQEAGRLSPRAPVTQADARPRHRGRVQPTEKGNQA